MTQLNWGILGPGIIAKEFANAIIDVNGKIAAVGARNLEKAQRFANEYNIDRVYGSYEDLLNDDDLDIIYIATPHTFHYEWIMESLKRNKHVLCEKSITVNGGQLKEIVDLATEKNLIVAEAMTIYHMPIYKKLRNILDSGQLGKLNMIQVSHGSYKEPDPSNRFFNPDLAGGAMLDIGTYALSLSRYFLSGQPNEVLTTVKKFETGVDEQVGILLKNEANEMAVISLTLRAIMPKNVIIAGEKGFILVEDYQRPTKATITFTEDGHVEVIEEGEAEKAFQYEVEAMNNYVLNKNENHTLKLSVDVMNLIDEVRKQSGVSYSFE
ncbi:oxidoreductase [Bacillus sp. AFS077874]|uniref:Gfo/Idh/MocA family protein n=1 Tax=unclassified Bacillus (in: firmicutes) TaxID=185979 RepID=UPI000BECCDCD|nr:MULTISPECIES: Gfo/Idh/MocA family oxidoreductase [unclassified Bacillus (in: firmicutes)]PEC50981.1 oxidoreductase [Bacillus sp. AFS096315]PET76358.1 oxidoreductase [Bacillus sp. AFS001701]PFM83227.1 oxidoreductase [Bacillus sp. AFS077874]